MIWFLYLQSYIFHTTDKNNEKEALNCPFFTNLSVTVKMLLQFWSQKVRPDVTPKVLTNLFLTLHLERQREGGRSMGRRNWILRGNSFWESATITNLDCSQEQLSNSSFIEIFKNAIKSFSRRFWRFFWQCEKFLQSLSFLSRLHFFIVVNVSILFGLFRLSKVSIFLFVQTHFVI